MWRQSTGPTSGTGRASGTAGGNVPSGRRVAPRQLSSSKHPPSKRVLGVRSRTSGRRVPDVVAPRRMHVLTSMYSYWHAAHSAHSGLVASSSRCRVIVAPTRRGPSSYRPGPASSEGPRAPRRPVGACTGGNAPGTPSAPRRSRPRSTHRRSGVLSSPQPHVGAVVPDVKVRVVAVHVSMPGYGETRHAVGDVRAGSAWWPGRASTLAAVGDVRYARRVVRGRAHRHAVGEDGPAREGTGRRDTACRGMGTARRVVRPGEYAACRRDTGRSRSPEPEPEPEPEP